MNKNKKDIIQQSEIRNNINNNKKWIKKMLKNVKLNFKNYKKCEEIRTCSECEHIGSHPIVRKL